MGIMNRIAEWIGSEPRKQQSMILDYRAAGNSIIPYTAGKPTWLPHDVRTYDSDAYRKIALVFRCIQYVANAAATAPLRAYMDVDGEAEELTDHELRKLFERPNPQMGEARFMSFITMVMGITGFVLVEKERDRLGNVVALWPLRSDWARPIPRNQVAPDWEYRIPGEQTARILKSADVIPITYADTPDRSATGIGPLEILLRETSVVNALTDFLKVFMDRGAMPLYIGIPSDDPSLSRQFQDPATIEAFRRRWRERYGGLGQATEPMVMPALKDVRPLGFDFNELAYVDLNQLQEVRICEAFGIPPILLGTDVGLERSTFANYAEARRSFYEDTMTPLWARLDDAFTRHLLNDRDFRADISLMFDTSAIPALQDDVNEATTRAVSLFTSSVISRHVAQRLAGTDPHGPDVFLQSFGQVEIPATAKEATPKPQPTATITDGQPSVDDEQDDEEARALPVAKGVRFNELPMFADWSDEPRIVTRAGRTYLNERALTVQQRAKVDGMVAHQRAAIAALADVLAPKMADYFDWQGQRIVDYVTGERFAAVTMETRAIEQIDWQSEADELRALLEAWLGEVEAQALASLDVIAGGQVSWDIANPLLATLHDRLGYRIRLITESTRADVEAVVRDALLEGTSMPELADKLRGLFAETYKNRHEAVARTESMHAYGQASELAYQRSGVVSRVMIADNEAHTESYKGAADGLTCAERNGLVVPVGRGMFHVGSDHPNGSACLIPVVDSLGGA